MARTPDGITARTVKKTLRMTEATEAALDRQRGDLTTSEYLRRLIVADGNRKGRARA